MDESCQLEKDFFPVMCVGYLKINTDTNDVHRDAIKKLKLKYKNPTEIKWINVSMSRLPLYKALIDYFFSNPIDFQCVLVKYKNKLDPTQLNRGSYDNFYYNLICFLLGRAIDTKDSHCKVFIDIKDTRGGEMLEKVRKLLMSTYKDDSPFTYFQHVDSEKSVFIQLADLFIGAITYKGRKEDKKGNASPAKLELINYLENRSGFSLDEGTEPWYQKFNIVAFQPKGLTK